LIQKITKNSYELIKRKLIPLPI